MWFRRILVALGVLQKYATHYNHFPRSPFFRFWMLISQFPKCVIMYWLPLMDISWRQFLHLFKILAQYQSGDWLGPLGDATCALLNQEKQFQNSMFGLLYM